MTTRERILTVLLGVTGVIAAAAIALAANAVSGREIGLSAQPVSLAATGKPPKPARAVLDDHGGDRVTTSGDDSFDDSGSANSGSGSVSDDSGPSSSSGSGGGSGSSPKKGTGGSGSGTSGSGTSGSGQTSTPPTTTTNNSGPGGGGGVEPGDDHGGHSG